MKIARHAQIIKLINQYDIETQEELAKKLEESGFAVTQATISRDIRQLKLTKVPKENGGDDTILCVARDDDAALVAAERLKKMVDGMEETGEEF